MRQERVSKDEAARKGSYISPEEMNTFWDNLDLLRNNPVNNELTKNRKQDISNAVKELGYTGKEAKQEIDKIWKFNKEMDKDNILSKMEGGSKKFEENLAKGAKESEMFNNMTPFEVADAAKIAPKETFFNWAPQTDMYKAGGSYISNLQGRTKYAGPVIEALVRQFPGQDKINLTVKEKPKKEKDE